MSVLQDCEISAFELQKILNKVVTKRKNRSILGHWFRFRFLFRCEQCLPVCLWQDLTSRLAASAPQHVATWSTCWTYPSTTGNSSSVHRRSEVIGVSKVDMFVKTSFWDIFHNLLTFIHINEQTNNELIMKIIIMAATIVIAWVCRKMSSVSETKSINPPCVFKLWPASLCHINTTLVNSGGCSVK